MAATPEAMRDERGFSLLELLITLLVISILVGIAVASYFFSTGKARETACKLNLRVIRDAIVMYQSANSGQYPPDLDSLVPSYIKDESGLYCPVSGDKYDYDPSTGDVSCPHCGP